MIILLSYYMKKLIIAEKPHLERFVTSCIHEKFVANKYKNSELPSYYESENYIVTHAFGHLFEAFDIEDYTKEPVEWKLDNLPFCPPDNHFYFKLKQKRDKSTNKMITDTGIKLQFEAIKSLINDTNTSCVIHCGDADREGEIIVRQIIKNSGCNKPVYRLWFNEETPEAFNASFCNMKNDSEYDNWANEGFTRLKTDWLYGINLTRYVTLKVNAPKGKPFRNGRVIDAMTTEIYNRDKEIENFVPVKYYALVSDEKTNEDVIHLRCKQTFPITNLHDANNRCMELNSAGASVTDIKTEKKTIGPGKLFSLTTLQAIMNKKFDMSLTESMKAIQSIYEKGLITYPRTNTEYLGSTEKDEVKRRIEVFTKQGYHLQFRDSKTIFDDSKIDGHSALCPTHKLATDLTGNEKLVYETIRNRFLAVFCAEPCTVNKSTIKITCDTEIFNLTGNVLLTKGFLEYEPKEFKDNILPQLNVGDIVRVTFKPIEDATKPPEHYTVTTFTAFLESPFVTEKTTEEERYNDLMKGLEIGTVATRTQIISNMIANGYIIEKKNSYLIAPAGIFLVESLKRMGIDMSKEKTVELSATLKKVNKGELSENDAIEMAMADLHQMMSMKNIDISSCQDEGIINPLGGLNAEAVGDCPLCDGKVYDLPYGYVCENNKKDGSGCNFIMFKNDKYIQKVTGKKLTLQNVSSILNKGYFIGKTKDSKDREYEVMILMKIKEDMSIGWSILNEIGTCPICGGIVKNTPFGFICENNTKENPNSCFFILFRDDKFIKAFTHKQITLSNAISLLSKGYLKYSIEKNDKSGKYGLLFRVLYDRQNKKMSWTKEFARKRR